MPDGEITHQQHTLLNAVLSMPADTFVPAVVWETARSLEDSLLYMSLLEKFTPDKATVDALTRTVFRPGVVPPQDAPLLAAGYRHLPADAKICVAEFAAEKQTPVTIVRQVAEQVTTAAELAVLLEHSPASQTVELLRWVLFDGDEARTDLDDNAAALAVEAAVTQAARVRVTGPGAPTTPQERSTAELLVSVSLDPRLAAVAVHAMGVPAHAATNEELRVLAVLATGCAANVDRTAVVTRLVTDPTLPPELFIPYAVAVIEQHPHVYDTLDGGTKDALCSKAVRLASVQALAVVRAVTGDDVHSPYEGVAYRALARQRAGDLRALEQFLNAVPATKLAAIRDDVWVTLAGDDSTPPETAAHLVHVYLDMHPKDVSVVSRTATCRTGDVEFADAVLGSRPHLELLDCFEPAVVTAVAPRLLNAFFGFDNDTPTIGRETVEVLLAIPDVDLGELMVRAAAELSELFDEVAVRVAATMLVEPRLALELVSGFPGTLNELEAVLRSAS